VRSHHFTRTAFWLAAATAVALLSLLLSLDYLHIPLVFFPFFLVWGWGGHKSQMCRERPEYGVCRPNRLLAHEDRRG
jgi:hypothetical protein